MTRLRLAGPIVLLALSTTAVAGAPAAEASDRPPGGTFLDDEASVHEADIEAIAAAGITEGCTHPSGFAFCPTAPVTRGETAVFLRRALALPGPQHDHFTDDEGSPFEGDINALADTGVVLGCAADRFCPDRIVSREEMAVFLARAFSLPTAESDYFTDDAQSAFQAEINAIAAAGITQGCTAAGDRFCPYGQVLRGQMASFLARVLGLQAPPAAPALTALAPGASGPQVTLLQTTLRDLHLYRGPIDGTYGEQLGSAVVAFHKLFRLERSDAWNLGDWSLVGLDAFDVPNQRPGEPNRIEVDIGRQLLFLVFDGTLEGIFPVSTGSGGTYISSSGNVAWSYTPRGDFTLFRFRPGWVHTRLGAIHNPWNFTYSFALHGFGSVPTHPASHGCIRVHLWDSDWLAARLWLGIPIHVWDG